MKKLLLFLPLLPFLVPLLLLSQQTQTNDITNTQPLYAVNSKYVQGLGPGYWPTCTNAGTILNCTGLTLYLTKGTVWCQGSVVSYAGGTLTMANNATNYVYLDANNACVPATSTNNFTAKQIPVATVITSGGAITQITDQRAWLSYQTSATNTPAVFNNCTMNPGSSPNNFESCTMAGVATNTLIVVVAPVYTPATTWTISDTAGLVYATSISNSNGIMWYAETGSFSGSDTITLTCTSGANSSCGYSIAFGGYNLLGIAAEFTGVSLGAPVDATGSAGGTSGGTVATSSFSTSAINDLIVTYSNQSGVGPGCVSPNPNQVATAGTALIMCAGVVSAIGSYQGKVLMSGSVTWQVAATAFFALSTGGIIINGQICNLGSTCNVNPGNAVNSLALNEGNGNQLGQLVLGSHQIPVGQGSGVVPVAKTIPDCQDVGGNHTNYTQSTDTWSCGTTGSGTQTIASGTAAMTTGAIGSGACGSTVTVSATGTTTSDAIAWAYNAGPGANPGVLIITDWPTANNVNFAYCNPTAASVTPNAATLNWRVTR